MSGVWLTDFKIYVGNNAGPSTPFNASQYEVCAMVCDTQSTGGHVYTCHTRPSGRHVAIAHYHTNVVALYLCEVEVYPEILNGKYNYYLR